MSALLALLLALLSPAPIAGARLLSTPYGVVVLWQQQSDALTVVVVKETSAGFVGIATIEGSAAGPHGAIDRTPAVGDRYFIGECWRTPALRCLPSYGPYQVYRTFLPFIATG